MQKYLSQAYDSRFFRSNLFYFSLPDTSFSSSSIHEARSKLNTTAEAKSLSHHRNVTLYCPCHWAHCFFNFVSSGPWWGQQLSAEEPPLCWVRPRGLPGLGECARARFIVRGTWRSSGALRCSVSPNEALENEFSTNDNEAVDLCSKELTSHSILGEQSLEVLEPICKEQGSRNVTSKRWQDKKKQTSFLTWFINWWHLCPHTSDAEFDLLQNEISK